VTVKLENAAKSRFSSLIHALSVPLGAIMFWTVLVGDFVSPEIASRIKSG
jgi:hypothetical protein